MKNENGNGNVSWRNVNRRKSNLFRFKPFKWQKYWEDNILSHYKSVGLCCSWLVILYELGYLSCMVDIIDCQLSASSSHLKRSPEFWQIPYQRGRVLSFLPAADKLANNAHKYTIDAIFCLVLNIQNTPKSQNSACFHICNSPSFFRPRICICVYVDKMAFSHSYRSKWKRNRCPL